MEELILRDPAVTAVGRWTGLDTNGYSPTPQNVGVLRVALKASGRRRAYPEISGGLREQLTSAIPSANVEFHQILEDMINDVSGVPAPLEVSLEGPDEPHSREVREPDSAIHRCDTGRYRRILRRRLYRSHDPHRAGRAGARSARMADDVMPLEPTAEVRDAPHLRNTLHRAIDAQPHTG